MEGRFPTRTGVISAVAEISVDGAGVGFGVGLTVVPPPCELPVTVIAKLFCSTFPLLPFTLDFAVIVALPAATAFTSPLLLTVATFLSEEE